MLTQKEATRISKFLSLVLRHQPQLINLSLDEGGWADVATLLQKLQQKGETLDRDTLQWIVETNPKKRFAFSDDGTRIRASQGHSIPVDLGYTAVVPPPVLYHGTAEKNREAIRATGLQKMSRQHVHLSADRETARSVGQRYGKPVVLEVLSGQMHGDGYVFFLSANGVWLTDRVPPGYLRFPIKTALD